MSFPIYSAPASDFGQGIDNIFFALTGLTVFFSILVLSIMLVLAMRYRRGAKVNRTNPINGHLLLELSWSLGPLFIGIFMFVWAAKPFAEAFRPPADATEIFVIGKQWMWHLQHTNGIREQNELHIPVGRAVKFTIISQDVIHGFSVPAMRIKRDALPGRYNTMWFQPNRTGKFHLYCTEYCGTNHSEMGGWVYVMSQADYQQWEQNNGNTATAQKQTPAEQGASLYQTLACANCHVDKDNVHGPTLYGLYMSNVKLSDGTTVIADDDYLRRSIINPAAQLVAGYPDIMQGYEVGDGPGYLSEEQILALISYIKTLGVAPPAATPTPAPAGTVKPAAGTKPTGGATEVRKPT